MTHMKKKSRQVDVTFNSRQRPLDCNNLLLFPVICLRIQYKKNCLTFPDDLIPLTIHRYTMIQATRSETASFQLRPLEDSMDGAMFKVSRYQKYVVGPLLLQERQEIINNSHVNGGSRICFKKADKVGGLGAALRPQVGPGKISKRGSGVKPPKAYSLNEAKVRKTYLALWFFNCRIEALHQRTLGPRQGGLETLDQINDAPRHDCIIVKRHIERDCSGSQPHSLEVR